MLRITAIVTLFIYMGLSIGLHVDVDTCCKSVAGLSLFAEPGDHEQSFEEDCCSMEGEPSCHPVSDQEQEGCPSDCVYIQVLLDTPPPAVASLNLAPTVLDVAQVLLLPITSNTETSKELCLNLKSPPTLAIEDCLFLTQGSFITYG